MLSYPVVLAFRWFMYPVAACGFVLELPEFERFVLEYPFFAVFESFVLLLGFPACISLAVVVFECGLSCGRWWVASYYLVSALLNPLLLFCIQLLSFCLAFSRFISLLRSPLSVPRYLVRSSTWPW
jgi:hypothetical protein